MDKTSVKEFHSILRVTDLSLSFCSQMECIFRQVDILSAGRILRFVRFFISDAGNQMKLLSERACKLNCPVSVVQQPPLDGSKIAAWCYWTEGEPNGFYSHKMVCGLVSEDYNGSSLSQTEEIFSKYEGILTDCNQTVADDCVRTWLFVRDVDTNYAGVVTGRKQFFDRIGLTSDTHYIASTGIQGCTQNHRNLVSMDAYSVGGLLSGQKCHLYAKTHLNPTYEYGVTFERGTSIEYGDRKHVFISGTASIDNKGQIVSEGDIVKQCERMMENVSALLEEASCTLEDIAVSIVYLRDMADYNVVSKLFHKQWPYLDPVIVLAPVCRPGWLVEMECIATKKVNHPEFPNF